MKLKLMPIEELLNHWKGNWMRMKKIDKMNIRKLRKSIVRWLRNSYLNWRILILMKYNFYSKKSLILGHLLRPITLNLTSRIIKLWPSKKVTKGSLLLIWEKSTLSIRKLYRLKNRKANRSKILIKKEIFKDQELQVSSVLENKAINTSKNN